MTITNCTFAVAGMNTDHIELIVQHAVGPTQRWVWSFAVTCQISVAYKLTLRSRECTHFIDNFIRT